MNKRKYSKVPLNYDEQIKLLKSRGLKISDEIKAKEFLEITNYYRLSAYFTPFEEYRHKFYNYASFENIVSLYEFDRVLRHLIMIGLEFIEIYFRSKIAYFLTNKYNDVFIHEKDIIFFDKDKHKKWLEKIHEETQRSHEVFINHYKNTYIEYPQLPLWVVVEIISFGALSMFYSNLIKENQKEISKFFNLHHTILLSWLHTFTYIRNICAHHSRLWNRKLAVSPKIPKDWKKYNINNKKVVSVIMAINYLLRYIPIEKEIKNAWRKDVTDLIEKNKSSVNNFYFYMGLKEGWVNWDIWSR